MYIMLNWRNFCLTLLILLSQVAIVSFLSKPAFAASNPTSRVSWTFDEIGTEAPNNRKLVRTSDGTLHAFISSLGVTNTCGGVSQASGLIYVNSTDNGTTWTCQSHLNTSSNFYWASAVIDSSDNIYLVYSGWDLMYRKLTKGAGATWTIGNEQTIITGSGSSISLGSVIEREGTTRLWIALQYRESSTASRTRVYYSDNFGTAPSWTLSADLDTPDSSGSTTHYPVIVRYGSNIGVIYANYNGSTYDLNWRHRADSDGLTTWSAAEIIVSTSSHNKHLAATVDNNNYIHLVYGSTGTNHNNVIVTYKYYNGASWSSAVTLSGAANSGGHSPSITTNGTDVWVFWQGRHNTGLGSSTVFGRVVYRKGISPFASGNFEAETVLNSADRAYDKIYTYIGGTYADKTTAGNDVQNNITLGASVGDITYFGHSEKYRAVAGLMATAGAGGVVAYEYWNGSAWTTLSTFATRFPDFTNATIGGYEVDFLPPSNWATTVVNSTNAPGSYYYVRARVTTAYTTAPVAENFWAYPETSAIQVPVKATGGILPIVWGETSPFTTGDAIVQFNSFSINANPSIPSSLGGHVSGSYSGDTTPTLTFSLSDPDSSDTVKYQIQIDDTSNFSSPVVDYTSALASQGSTSFTVGQAAGGGSYATGSSGQTLSNGSYYWRVKATDNSSAESSYATANSGSVAFTIDGTAPSVPGTPTTSSSQTDTTPTWTWTTSTDGGSGLASTPYTVQWSKSSSFSSEVSSSTSNTASFTHSSALADGTWYFRVKAKDAVDNESSYSSNGSITIDATNPTSADLNSPENNSYTNNERPSFKWKAAADATSGLSKYKFEIDNGDSGDFNIDGIPVSRTTALETEKYVISYENFSDSDNANNYISIYTKSSSSWSSGQNDGRLKEGKRTWKVVAVDNAGNENSSSRTLFVDKHAPVIKLTQFNAIPFSERFTTNDTTPKFFGRITDSLSGESDSSSALTREENKVASGPDKVEIKVEKKNIFGVYVLHTSTSVNLSEIYWSTGERISDNSKNLTNKNSPFSYEFFDPLPLGEYRLSVVGKDKSGNTGTSVVVFMRIGKLNKLLTPKEAVEVDEQIEQQAPKKQEKTIREKITEPVERKNEEGKFIFEQSQRVIGIFLTNLDQIIKNAAFFVRGIRYEGEDALTDGLKAPSEFAARISTWVSYSFTSFNEIILDDKPTIISDVRVEHVTPTTAIIVWKTNHHATSKVNYGTSLDYGKTVQSNNNVREHRVEIKGLRPKTTYNYEVMSQGKNYVYDANHIFITTSE